MLEADREIGGYCKTVQQDGFVWDYSGHFFHFKHPDVEAWLRARMPGQTIRTIAKRALIAYRGSSIDFPFQKNIHQLPQDEFIDCLHDLYFARGRRRADAGARRASRRCSTRRFGRAIAEKFLIPYNEKLYACDLGTLDKDAMGRFFPHADLADIIRNMKTADNGSYNATFTYPEGGAIQYVKALASAVPPGAIALDEPLLAIDLDRKVARTATARDRLSSAWSPRRRCNRFAGDVRTAPRPGGVHLEQGARLQPGLRPQGAAATSTGSTTPTGSASSIGSAFTTTSSRPTA